MARARIAVFASGGGSNLGALFDHFGAPDAAAAGAVELVLSDKADAGALLRAQARGVATHRVADPSDGLGLCNVLVQHDIDLIVLAGWLKLVPKEVIAAWPGRVLNVHPSLLPAFGGAGMYGARVHRAVVVAGVRITGATVHFVNEQYDRGAIAAQWPVPVCLSDTAADVAARVLRVEHVLLPLVTEAVATGELYLSEDGRVHGHIGRTAADAHSPASRFRLPATSAAADTADDIPDAPQTTRDAPAVANAEFAYELARLFPH